MNDAHRWIYFEGPEPEQVRLLLDALRDQPPATPEEREHAARVCSARIDAMVARHAEEMASDALDAPEPPPEAGCPGDPGAEAPPQGPSPLAATAAALDIPAEVWAAAGRLPFRPPSQAGPTAARTLQVPVMRGPGDTVPQDDDSIARAVARVLPFAGNTVGAGVIPFPRLELEQYASLCAELAAWPNRSAEILIRYHLLSDAARGALDEHWHRHFAENPARRAAFDAAFAQYTAWLRTLRR